MIKLTTSILILFVLIIIPKAHAEEKPFINDLEVGALGVVSTMAFCALGNHEQDKKSHCYAGLVPGVWGTIIFKKARWGTISGCAAGALKEIYDHNTEGNVADLEDFGYTCGAALVSSYFTEKIIIYQHKINTGTEVFLVEKPNTYVGVNLAFSTGQYYR